jgi:hypothetical protein
MAIPKDTPVVMQMEILESLIDRATALSLHETWDALNPKGADGSMVIEKAGPDTADGPMTVKFVRSRQSGWMPPEELD